MAKQTTIATAASQRQPRSTSGKVSMARKGVMTTKKALTETGSGSLKGLRKKRPKMRGRQNEAAKARKLKETAEAKKSLLKQRAYKGSAGYRSGIKTPKKAPRPENRFNDELKSYGPEYEVEKILDSSVEKKKRQYLIKWVGWPESASTWEPEVNLRNALDLIAEFDNDNPTKP